MRKIKDLINKPSEALEAMVRGVERVKAKEWDNFVIDLDTFGYKVGNTCFGCMATCAVYELGGKSPDTDNVLEKQRYFYLGFDKCDLDDFEVAMNSARMGGFISLFRYFGFEYNFQYDNRFCITNENWETEIEKVNVLIKEMQDDGF